MVYHCLLSWVGNFLTTAHEPCFRNIPNICVDVRTSSDSSLAAMHPKSHTVGNADHVSISMHIFITILKVCLVSLCFILRFTLKILTLLLLLYVVSV